MDNLHLRELVDDLLSTAPRQSEVRQDSPEASIWLARAATAVNFMVQTRSLEGKSFVELKKPVGAGAGDYPALVTLLEEARHVLKTDA